MCGTYTGESLKRMVKIQIFIKNNKKGYYKNNIIQTKNDV